MREARLQRASPDGIGHPARRRDRGMGSLFPLQQLGWTTVVRDDKHYYDFLHDVAFQHRSIWPYQIMGMGLGIGMALTMNGFRASKRWTDFLEAQSALTSGQTMLRLVVALAGVLRRFAWPIVLCMLVADVLSFWARQRDRRAATCPDTTASAARKEREPPTQESRTGRRKPHHSPRCAESALCAQQPHCPSIRALR